MARFPLLVSALTASVMLAASPLASATSPELAPGVEQGALPVQQPDVAAQSANMLPMAMCGDRSQLVADLEQQFSEQAMAVGQVDNNAVVEIFVSDTGSWTILATGTDGKSCIVSAGEGFESTTLVRGVDA